MAGLAKEKSLREMMARLGVREEDIVERFIRSQGPGGQKQYQVVTRLPCYPGDQAPRSLYVQGFRTDRRSNRQDFRELFQVRQTSRLQQEQDDGDPSAGNHHKEPCR